MEATQIAARPSAGLGTNRASAPALPLAALVFWGTAAAMMAVIAYSAVNLTAVVSYKRDIWHHLSVYRELIAAPFNAMNPHVATDDPSRSYSPWTVFVALLARMGGLDAFGAIAISAILSGASILGGIYLFTKEYVQHRWAPALFLLIFLGSWWAFVNHTGYHTIATFLYSMSYPFAIVLGLGFVLWWAVLQAFKRSATGFALLTLAMVPASAGLFITHQLQGLFAVAAACGFALFAGNAPVARRAAITVALVAGLLASQVWWYFDPIAYVLSPDVQTGHSAKRFLDYKPSDLPLILQTLGLALLGLVGLINRQTGRLRLELALPLLMLAAGFTYLLMNGSWVNTRILPFVALYLQLGLLMYLLGPSPAGGQRLQGLARTGLIVALTLGFCQSALLGYGTYAKAHRFLSTGEIGYQHDSWSQDIRGATQLAEGLAPGGATVMAHRETAFPMQSTALAVVAIPRLFAEVADMQARQADTLAFFDPATTTPQRCGILARYDVQLIAYRDVWLPVEVRDQLSVFGPRHGHDEMSFIPASDGQFEICQP
jgi:hypothetical protein